MISVSELTKYYPVVSGMRSILSKSRGKYVRAVDGVSFHIPDGSVMGLVGESGCGKSTTGRVLVGLEQPTGGRVEMDGVESGELKARDAKAFYRAVQMVFQDPYGSINPQYTVARVVGQPLVYQGGLNRAAIREKVAATLELVGLIPASDFMDKYPHLLSGGQRQRLCIGRAIVLEPSFLVADEPISMLDVSIKSGILTLLARLVARRNLSMLYITHDLATVGHICDTTAIMYLGRIVEHGPTDLILDHPGHPYTRALVSAIPVPEPGVKRAAPDISGAIPDPINLPTGCRFHPRCPRVADICRRKDPVMTAMPDGRRVACHLVDADHLTAPGHLTVQDRGEAVDK